MSEQPEALELISLFELEADPESLYRRAAAELHRLHAVESGAKVELMRRDNLIDSLNGLCESYRTQVERLEAEANTCGSGAGCLHKEALIESLQVEVDRLVDANKTMAAPVAAVPALVTLTLKQITDMHKARYTDPDEAPELYAYMIGIRDAEKYYSIGLAVGGGGAK